jgi:hypothetical protein
MDNQNKGGQQNPTETQDPNLQKKPQGTDVNRDQDQQNRNRSGNQGGNQSGNQADQGDRKQDERKSA